LDEADYCSPPLAMERASVLDRYFDDIPVDPVDSQEQSWNKMKATLGSGNNLADPHYIVAIIFAGHDIHPAFYAKRSIID
jgi:hypothetical protein